jgi:hypothetical protein
VHWGAQRSAALKGGAWRARHACSACVCAAPPHADLPSCHAPRRTRVRPARTRMQHVSLPSCIFHVGVRHACPHSLCHAPCAMSKLPTCRCVSSSAMDDGTMVAMAALGREPPYSSWSIDAYARAQGLLSKTRLLVYCRRRAASGKRRGGVGGQLQLVSYSDRLRSAQQLGHPSCQQ